MHHTSKDARRRLARAAIGAGGAAALAVSTLAYVPAASAADPVTPSFPDNIVVFPDRDFVSVEGYDSYAGSDAVVEVIRPKENNKVMGRVVTPISGTEVAFEINHPGGACWGDGPGNDNFQVTPNIQAGDIVRMTLPDGRVEQTVTSSATVTQDMALSGTELTVVGSVGEDVNKAQMEQRIINPDLTDTDVSRRDIRAVPGELTPSDKGGYASSLKFPTPTTFRATYVFNNAATAEIAAAADHGERAMSWQVEDAEANRQGLTIAEFGEAGGPGMGDCPAGPDGQDAPAGTFAATPTGERTVRVDWKGVSPQAGAAEVSGYSVEAIDTSTGAVVGQRVGPTMATTTLTLPSDPAGYDIEVRSMTGSAMSAPFTTAAQQPQNPGVQPTITATQGADGAVTVVFTNGTGGQIYYTTGENKVVEGGSISDEATFYDGPIPITAPTELHIVAVSGRENFSDVINQSYTPAAGPSAPVSAPQNVGATATQNSVSLTWDGVTGAEGYQVSVYDASGVLLGTQPPVTSIPRQTVTGLAPATTYQFTVTARNAGGSGPESDPKLTQATQSATDRVTISRAQWKARDFRVEGTGSDPEQSVTIRRTSDDVSIGTAEIDPPVAPETVGTWALRLRNGAAPASNPGSIYVESSGGGTTLPFPVANK